MGKSPIRWLFRHPNSFLNNFFVPSECGGKDDTYSKKYRQFPGNARQAADSYRFDADLGVLRQKRVATVGNVRPEQRRILAEQY